MKWLLVCLRGIGRLVSGVFLLLGIGLAWGILLYLFVPWVAAEPGVWPQQSPIAVTSPATGVTRVILYRSLADEVRKDPSLLPWPGSASGTASDGQVETEWKTVAGKNWQFEVSWDDRDHLLQSRYRLDGQQPVLVESRGRDVAIAFQAIVLALPTLLVWKLAAWWHRRRLLRDKRQSLIDS